MIVRSAVRTGQRWLRRQLRPRAVILEYHRVARLASDPFRLAVTPEHFAEHLDVIRRLTRTVSLVELRRRLGRGTLRPWTTVLTFDDGYADTFHAVKPLLERHGVPATVFVVSGHVGAHREFWWDELERLLLVPGTLPERLSAKAGSIRYAWETDGARRYTEHDRVRSEGWHFGRDDDPTPRHRLFRDVYLAIRDVPEPVRTEVLDQLLAGAGIPRAVRATHRTLTATELHALAGNGLVEIGAHTVTHALLSNLPPGVQRFEIEQSRRTLEEIAGRRVESFSFPHGHYGSETLRLVRETGFTSACTERMDAVSRAANVYELPRYTVTDCDGAQLADQLEEWL